MKKIIKINNGKKLHSPARRIRKESADNQERDSDSSDNKLESRPGVLKVSNAKELVETLKDNKNKDIVFIEEGCHKIVGKFPFGNVPARCGDGFDSETILCEDCRVKQKAQEGKE